jgi:hypothetical protein
MAPATARSHFCFYKPAGAIDLKIPQEADQSAEF